MKKLMIMALLLLAGCGEKSKVSASVEDFVGQLFAGDMNRAVEMVYVQPEMPVFLAANAKQLLVPALQGLQAELQRTAKFKGVKVEEVKFIDAEETRARVRYRVEFANGDRKSAEMLAIKVGGRWLMNPFE